MIFKLNENSHCYLTTTTTVRIFEKKEKIKAHKTLFSKSKLFSKAYFFHITSNQSKIRFTKSTNRRVRKVQPLLMKQQHPTYPNYF